MSLKNNPTSKSSKIRVGLTIGDPAGIGPAITLQALKILKGKADFTVIGSRLVLAKAAKMLKIAPLPVEIIDVDNVQEKNFKFGSLNAQNGAACLEYLDAALELLKKNKIDCLVTCPISKKAINLSGSKFSGHTEYLAQGSGVKDLVMMLINDKLKFSLVTRHIRLRDVSRMLTRKKLENNILNTLKGLKSLFLIKKPRLVVCGINPHASDNGVMGTEEQRIIIPVIKSLNKKLNRLAIGGVCGADVAISQAAKGKFDCVIAAYHDQALIALKLTGFDSGVNLTLGLPFVRTSPLHGVAFDIAGKPALANPRSLIAAIKLAIKCTLNQRKA
ncbi:MAG: 4-hydroxythreonine-4-phosphate dehydrogenase PdxA [Candidatus Omnitrophica bacterium]|nr:4-hydroxythreonine-4-phosphate dehydrogenase PdxA [Candidatus Omnitrophota bacterium]MBU4468489.1 4-hydroxythreonine-4-phosphate dehydrogenase PdxA [Candidatus Omnitrophota bacterium]